MRQAIRDLLSMCPASMKTLRANVVLLSGKVDDDFAPRLQRSPCTLEQVLLETYEAAASEVLVYSLPHGLHHVKTSEDQARRAPTAAMTATAALSPSSVITRTMADARSRKRSRPGDSVGRFANSPAEALREIHRVLRSSESAFVLFNYSTNILLVSESSADVASLLERLPMLCRERGHLVIFAGPTFHPDLARTLPEGTQRIFRLTIGGPDEQELQATIVREEVSLRRSLLDYTALPLVLSALEHLGAKPECGLTTITENLLKDPNTILCGAWARQNGPGQFDPERIDLEALRSSLETRLIGQDDAKRTAVERLQHFIDFGRDGPAPFMRLLFVGPSGVGKTEMAKIVCEHAFGSRHPMLLIPCTEYSQPHEVAKLLGAPPGYTGHEQPGLLESHRDQFPAGLLLLDEFEKAHADIRRFFMNILEEGFAASPRSQGGQSVKLDFSNYIVIATSNAGSHVIDVADKKVTDPSPEDRKRWYEDALKTTFDSALLGRFGEIVIFEFLSVEQMMKIVRLEVEAQIALFTQRCVEKFLKTPELEIQPNFYEWSANRSDRAYGARGLREKVKAYCQSVFGQWLRSDPRPSRVRLTPTDGGAGAD